MDKKTAQRLAQQSRPRHPQHAITRPAQGGPVTIEYAHDGTLQYMIFSRPTDHIGFTPEQVDAVIERLKQGKLKLAEHQANGGPVTTQGNDRVN